MGGSEKMTSIVCQSWRVRPAYGWSAYRPSIVYAKKKNVSVVAYNSNDIIGAEYGEVCLRGLFVLPTTTK